MSTTGTDWTLAELCITAVAEAWRNDGELLASGFGVIPRLGADLARLTFNSALMITGAEAYLIAESVPLGCRSGYQPQLEGWMPYSRTFDLLWHGRRHAMMSPVQIDRYGQMNVCAIGDYRKPKAALLGMRGFPGNSIHHRTSAFVPDHSRRVFVDGEVDVVCSLGFNPARWPGGVQRHLPDLRIIVTNLGVLDFEGPDHQMRVRYVHPGVTFAKIQENTGFPLAGAHSCEVTPVPTASQLALIRERLDPDNQRAGVLRSHSQRDGRSGK